MKDITYRCDLCRATSSADAVSTFFVGLYWSDFPVHGWIEKEPHLTEHHICKTCLNSLQIIGDNKKPKAVQP